MFLMAQLSRKRQNLMMALDAFYLGTAGVLRLRCGTSIQTPDMIVFIQFIGPFLQ